jgi:hypothetical protein
MYRDRKQQPRSRFRSRQLPGFPSFTLQCFLFSFKLPTIHTSQATTIVPRLRATWPLKTTGVPKVNNQRMSLLYLLPPHRSPFFLSYFLLSGPDKAESFFFCQCPYSVRSKRSPLPPVAFSLRTLHLFPTATNLRQQKQTRRRFSHRVYP